MSQAKPLLVKFCKRVLGNGVFIDTYAKRGECIHKLKGHIKSTPCKYSVQISANRHIIDEPIGINLNHSFSPSACIEGNSVIAVHDLKPGDEITFNYNKNEAVVVSPFDDFEDGAETKIPVVGYKNIQKKNETVK